MADGKKVEPFKTELFGASESTSSLGIGFEAFSSPFSLGPALGSSKEASSSPSKLSTSSHHGSPGPGSTHTSRTGSPLPPKASVSTGGPPIGSSQVLDSSGNLDTIPLDSPEQPEGSFQRLGPGSGEVQNTDSVSRLLVSEVRKDQRGWNDPPSGILSTPSRSSHVTAGSSTEDFQVQPLAPKQLETTLNPGGGQSVATPPTNRDTAGSGSNPYRIGSSLATRKPAYGTSGIASFGSSTATKEAALPGGPSQPHIMVPSQPGGSTSHMGPPLAGGSGYSQTGGALGTSQVQSHFQSPGPEQVPPGGYSSVDGPTFSTSSMSSVGSPHSGVGGVALAYAPVQQHWFYLRPGETYWIPFSMIDSQSLESAFQQARDASQQVLVPTDGGRYDVDLHARKRSSVYWAEPESYVRCSSWFYKGQDERWYIPYDEQIALHLEDQYKSCCEKSSWNVRVPLADGESVMFHSQGSMVHYPAPPPSHLALDIEAYHSQPKAVMRGFSDVDKVEPGEEMKVDHLVFVVHGIGAHCDLSFRSLVDCVDDFREVSQLMLKTHRFPGRDAPPMSETEVGQQQSSRISEKGRVEYLPVHWHAKLHTTGVDGRVKALTLPSISRLREFTNTTLLDILYFTSPLFCQTIMSEVASEMNRIFDLFRKRNPSFDGGVSLVGHSLGSVILFDLLGHQPSASGGPSPPSVSVNDVSVSDDVTSVQASGSSSSGISNMAPTEGDVVDGDEDEGEGTNKSVTIETVLAQLGLENLTESFHNEQVDLETLLMCSDEDLKELKLGFGPRKKLSSYIKQHKEEQEMRRQKKAAARERAQKEEEKRKAESSDEIDRSSSKVFGAKIVYGPAGTGQAFVKYPALQFVPQNLFAIGSPIGLFLTVRGLEELGPEYVLPSNTKLFNIYHPFDPVAYRIEPLLSSSAPERGLLMPHHKGRKRFHLELYDNLGTMGASIKQHLVEGMRNMWQQLNEFARSHTSGATAQSVTEMDDSYSTESVSDPAGTTAMDSTATSTEEKDWLGGAMNEGRRVDHVLQEKPIEKLNEYLFALSSHLCYWRSEDTALFLLKEVYNCQNVPISP